MFLKRFIKKWAFIVLILCFDFFIALKTGVGFFYFIFWFLLSLVFFSFTWIVVEYLTAVIYLERKTPVKVKEDDSLEIKAVIENRGIVPVFNLVLEDFVPCSDAAGRIKRKLLDFLPPGVSLHLKYKVHCPQRGRYKIGPFTVYYFDPLGLFYLRKKFKQYSEIYVFPKTFNIRRFPSLLKGVSPWFGIETTRVSGEDDEFYGVREYKGSDPIKRIHWFSSARKNKLMVKQFQRQAFFRATILFNLESKSNFGEGKERVCEYIIRLAASVSKYLLDNGVSLEIISNTGEFVHILSNKGPEYQEDVLKFLALAQAKSKISLGETFEEFARFIPSDTTLIVIMLDKDWVYLPAILPLLRRNVSLIPLILVSSTFQYSFNNVEVIKDMRIKLSKSFNFNPILLSRGDNLEAAFLKI